MTERIMHLTEALRQGGLKITPQRLAICRLLAYSTDHPTAQSIYEELRPNFSSLSLATVYNTLDTLVKLGVINNLGSAGDDAVHYDAGLTPHVNLACIRCHKMVDLDSQTVQALELEVASNSGYQLLGSRVVYYGICPECRQAQATP